MRLSWLMLSPLIGHRISWRNGLRVVLQYAALRDVEAGVESGAISVSGPLRMVGLFSWTVECFLLLPGLLRLKRCIIKPEHRQFLGHANIFRRLSSRGHSARWLGAVVQFRSFHA